MFSKKPFKSYHAPARRLLAVGENAFLGVFGVEREIQALDGLAAFVGELGADAAFILEAGNFVAAGAAVMLDQRLALLLELRIVHEIRGRVGCVGMLLRHQDSWRCRARHRDSGAGSA